MPDRRTDVFGEAAISASGSLSTAVEVNGALSVSLYVPTWTDSAAITFQAIATPGQSTYLDVYDELGQEVQIPASTHNRVYNVPELVGMHSIKVRSGTSGAAQAQTAAETITVFGTR